MGHACHAGCCTVRHTSTHTVPAPRVAPVRMQTQEEAVLDCELSSMFRSQANASSVCYIHMLPLTRPHHPLDLYPHHL